MKINATRMSDGTKVVIEHEDCGDTVPAYCTDGTPYRAYTSRFRIGGEERFMQIDATLADAGGNAAQTREVEETAALVGWRYEYGPDDLILG